MTDDYEHRCAACGRPPHAHAPTPMHAGDPLGGPLSTFIERGRATQKAVDMIVAAVGPSGNLDRRELSRTALAIAREALETVDELRVCTDAGQPPARISVHSAIADLFSDLRQVCTALEILSREDLSA